ncbi:MAG: TIGR03960 family B12-binding radical SAM protein [Candidatus Eisenbacteria bacterium]|nr:TIGR03960 family B12-binding radical SAM protein [Candidatus Eisenbacteria bacterium]
MSDLSRQIDALLPLVTKPSRYLGNEFHVVHKTPEPGMVQWCLLMPEVYEIGMSHWGLKVLYEVLNRRPDALAERSYAPWFDMEAQLRRHQIPLFALESRRPLSAFDFVGFSLQYELTYTNLLNCLDLAGIPLRSEDRREEDPLIIAGGPCVSNPEPLSDFIDLFLIGDGEEAVQILTHAYKLLRGRPRREILRELCKIEGIYVPSMYEASYGPDGLFAGIRPLFPDVPARVRRTFITNLDDAPVPETPVVPLQDIVQNRLTVEVVRGCTQGCRFCQAGYLYRPIRERSIEKLLEIADNGIRKSGWDEVGLVSLSTADYTQLEPLADVMNARFGRDQVAISLPSLRADSFGVGIADRVKETKKTGFTFAPEAGSERLRLAMNKIITDEEFFSAARIAYERGWKLIKMYFMVGLPTETWDDVEGIVRFVNRVREIGREYGPGRSINASVGAFVPKSHTPLQWDGFESIASLREKVEFLKREVNTSGSRLKWHFVETSHLEAVMSLGDRRLGRALEIAFRKGARFDGWTEHFNHRMWMDALAEAGVDPTWYTRRKELDAPLAWDHIDIGVLKKWLVRERKKTDEQQFEIGKSLVADCRHGDCTACGIPGLPNDTELTPKIPSEEFERLLEKARALAPRNEEQGILWPARIRYEKTGPCRFISHLETMAVVARAFRMARIPVAHTQGHNPRPRFSFGPPLPVGVEGCAEAFDADLMRPWTSSFAEQLNAVLPRGLRILDGQVMTTAPGTRRASLMAEGERATYRIDLSDLPAETRARLLETAASFAGRESCVVERTAWAPKGSREITSWESPMDPMAEPEPAEGPFTNGSDGTGAGAADGDAAIAEGANAALVSAEVTAVPGDRDRAPGRDRHRRDRNPQGRDRHANRGRANRGRANRGGKDDAPRTVDLKQAIIRLEFGSDARALDLEVFLAHANGQVANPKVILERLFLLGPEEQARVRILREAILRADGRLLVPVPVGTSAVATVAGTDRELSQTR